MVFSVYCRKTEVSITLDTSSWLLHTNFLLCLTLNKIIQLFKREYLILFVLYPIWPVSCPPPKLCFTSFWSSLPVLQLNWSTTFHPASVPLHMLVFYLESSPSSSLLLAKQKPFLTHSNSCLLILHMFPREAFLNLARVSCDLRELSSLPSRVTIVSTCNYILISVSLMVSVFSRL